MPIFCLICMDTWELIFRLFLKYFSLLVVLLSEWTYIMLNFW